MIAEMIGAKGTVIDKDLVGTIASGIYMDDERTVGTGMKSCGCCRLQDSV